LSSPRRPPILHGVSPAGFGPAVDETIDCDARAPAVARRAVEDLSANVDPGVLRDAQLLVSEVVTNSIKHSGSDEPIQLRVWERATGLKVEVTDGGLGFEASEPTMPGEGEGGRGLLILAALADRWGTSCDARARVWFELWPRSVSGSAQAG
jgi:anti-sigma regulatory factor (Ser/Thr protein kinase)